MEKMIMYDVEALKDAFILKDGWGFEYHFEMLKLNLKDYFKETKMKGGAQ